MRRSHTTINNKMNELCVLKIINEKLVIGGRLPLIGLSRPVFIFQNILINSISINFKFFVLVKQRERRRERERAEKKKGFFSSFLQLSIKAPGLEFVNESQNNINTELGGRVVLCFSYILLIKIES